MVKPKRVLCKRTLIIGNNYYYEGITGIKRFRDNRMLVEGDWYDVVYNQHDTEETFTIIDNQDSPHLFFMYDYQEDEVPELPRNYAKWFYTEREVRKMKLQKIGRL